MKYTTFLSITSLFIVSAITNASEQNLESLTIDSNKTNLDELFDFSLNFRSRYEFRDEETLDPSHAITLRARPGIKFSPVEQFSLFLESEHTVAIIDDYNAGPQPQLKPSDPSNTGISDPENNELNQAFLQFKLGNFNSKIGRQRYILDQAAFIGNVGWRQNEQTLDAASISYKEDDFEFSYAYANRVNRIFGEDAEGFAKKLDGSFHILNGKKSFQSFSLGSYAYLFDVDEIDPNSINFRNLSSTNTFGIFGLYEQFYGEFAYQTDAGNSTVANESLYIHAKYSAESENFNYQFGVEWLEDGFVTPLATVHAFNGFADVFIGNRLGLVNSWEGLTDIYAMAGTKINDLALKGYIHFFMDDSMDQNYGWELDLVAVQPINDNTSVLAKAAFFFGDNDSTFSRDVSQLSVQLDYTF